MRGLGLLYTELTTAEYMRIRDRLLRSLPNVYDTNIGQ
jgi:hypothetical protein